MFKQNITSNIVNQLNVGIIVLNGVVKRLKKIFKKNSTTGRVINDVEKRVNKLEDRVQHMEQYSNQEPSSPIVIEQLYVEKLLVDKVELNNNIGTLEISELSGMLNIGANYGGGVPQHDKELGQDPPPPQDKDKKQSQQAKNAKYNNFKQSKREQGPTFNIDFKKPE